MEHLVAVVVEGQTKLRLKLCRGSAHVYRPQDEGATTPLGFDADSLEDKTVLAGEHRAFVFAGDFKKLRLLWVENDYSPHEESVFRRPSPAVPFRMNGIS